MALDNTYLKVSDGTGDAALMHVTANRLTGSTTISVDTLVGIPPKFIATSGTLNAQGFIDPATVTNFFGHINGSSLVIDGFCPGSSDTGNTTAQVVVIKPNTSWANAVAEQAERPADWAIIDDAFAFASVDGQTGVVTVPTGAKSRYGVGKRLKLQQQQALTSYWPFDANSNDSVGSNNGTNTSVTFTSGKFSNAATFNGTTSKIVITDATVLKPAGAFTIGMWFKTSATGAYKTLYQSYSENTNACGIRAVITNANVLGFFFGNNTTNFDFVITGTANVCDGNWHYAVFSYQNNFGQIYLDGVLEGSDWTVTPVYAATNYVRVGASNFTGTDQDFFTGQIDDLFFINGYALGEDLVAAKYAAASAQGTAALTVTKYSIITAVTDTTLSAYFGTDYALVNATISGQQVSGQKAPLGFPLSPAKWAVTLTNATNLNFAPPTGGTWYNLGSLSITVPLGVWNIRKEGSAGISQPSGAQGAASFTLSTANNSESDKLMTTTSYVSVLSQEHFVPHFLSRTISLAAKTQYFVNLRASANTVNVELRGDQQVTVVQAVSAYL